MTVPRARWAQQHYPDPPGAGGAADATAYSLVLRPGDPLGNHDNVFTSWGALYAVASTIQGGVRVNLDDSLAPIHMPAGTYNVDGWTWVNGTGFATLIIDNGAHATWHNLWLDGLTVTYNGATDFFAPNAAFGETNLYILDGAILTCTAAGRFLAPSGVGAFSFITTLPACGIGDGTHAVFASVGGATCETFQSGGQFADNAQVGGTLDYDMSVFVDPSNQFSNGVGLIPLDQTPLVRFAPGTSGNGPTGFSTWAALYAACFGVAGGGVRSGGVTVIVDDSHAPAHVTAGSYDVTQWRFIGAPNPTTTSGGAALLIDAGVVFTGGAVAFDQVDVTFAGAAALMTANAATPEVNISTSNGATIVCTDAGPLATAAAGGFLFVICHDSGVLGDGVHTVFSSTGGTAFVLGFNGTDPKVDAFAGAGTTYDYDASSAPNLPQGAGVTLRQLDSASNMAYTAAVLANWSGTNPTSVANALDRIAAHVGPIP